MRDRGDVRVEARTDTSKGEKVGRGGEKREPKSGEVSGGKREEKINARIRICKAERGPVRSVDIEKRRVVGQKLKGKEGRGDNISAVEKVRERKMKKKRTQIKDGRRRCSIRVGSDREGRATKGWGKSDEKRMRGSKEGMNKEAK
ncbi:hypothetical protein HNY73_013991 [Argiope bruennichi]|uniref:Uncharacterized protein n=1 Tax=Argiope bruennichi TaxID=94029 RepID=A0A8T0ERJ6_ARGBR|nr:hypothetical protein HNY73_013991 [Argiope bruennichi]